MVFGSSFVIFPFILRAILHTGSAQARQLYLIASRNPLALTRDPSKTRLKSKGGKRSFIVKYDTPADARLHWAILS